MATNLNFCASSTLASLAACVAAAGGPQHPQQLQGSGSPDGVYVGYWTGLDTYYDTTGNQQYTFTGDVGGTSWHLSNS